MLDTNPCKYLLCVKGEYFYARNCYFEGKLSNLESTGVILDNCHEVYINNSDICNFRGGTGLIIKGAYNIYINNTTLCRCKTCVDLDCSQPLTNINLNIDVYDEAITNKIITLHRKEGTTGVLIGINGNINVRGNINQDSLLIDGKLYFGENKIYINNYTDNRLNYSKFTPVFPRFEKFTLSNGIIIMNGNTNVVNYKISNESPFYDHNLPNLKWSYNSGIRPQKVEIYNTYGGEFGIRATYPESVINPYTELFIRFVD